MFTLSVFVGKNLESPLPSTFLFVGICKLFYTHFIGFTAYPLSMDLLLFCNTYLIAEHIRLKVVLDQMPRYKAGIHGGKPVIREYSGSGENISRVISHFGTKNYPVMCKKFDFYNDCVNRNKAFLAEIKRRHLTIPDDFKFVRDESLFDVRAWEQYEACANPLEVNTGYYDDYGFNVRSRGEMIIGNVLKELGLEAKYEPSVPMKGTRKKNPDYSFPVRIIDRCFFVEFLGMTDDDTYLNNNHGKIDEYMHCGILPNRDLILISGTKNWIPSHESLKRKIASFINDAVLSAYNRKDEHRF